MITNLHQGEISTGAGIPTTRMKVEGIWLEGKKKRKVINRIGILKGS